MENEKCINRDCNFNSSNRFKIDTCHSHFGVEDCSEYIAEVTIVHSSDVEVILLWECEILQRKFNSCGLNLSDEPQSYKNALKESINLIYSLTNKSRIEGLNLSQWIESQNKS